MYHKINIFIFCLWLLHLAIPANANEILRTICSYSNTEESAIEKCVGETRANPELRSLLLKFCVSQIRSGKIDEARKIYSSMDAHEEDLLSVISEVYENNVENTELLLKFVKILDNFDEKFRGYKQLFKEMIKKNHLNTVHSILFLSDLVDFIAISLPIKDKTVEEQLYSIENVLNLAVDGISLGSTAKNLIDVYSKLVTLSKNATILLENRFQLFMKQKFEDFGFETESMVHYLERIHHIPLLSQGLSVIWESVPRNELDCFRIAAMAKNVKESDQFDSLAKELQEDIEKLIAHLPGVVKIAIFKIESVDFSRDTFYMNWLKSFLLAMVNWKFMSVTLFIILVFALF